MRVATAVLLSLTLMPTTGFAMSTVLPVEHMNNTDTAKISLSKTEITEPFPSEVYYGRSLLSEEGKKAWDVALSTLLKFDNSKKQYKRDKAGHASVVIDYAKLGLRPTEDDAKKIQTYLVSNEARVFHLRDIDAVYTKDSSGIVLQQTFSIENALAVGSSYKNLLLEIEKNVSSIMSVITDDMTIFQQVRAIQAAYEKSLANATSGTVSDIRGAFTGKNVDAMGYAKGWMYLMQRLGVNAITVKGSIGASEAWNLVKLEGKWFIMDTFLGGIEGYLRGTEFKEIPTDNQAFAALPEVSETRVPVNYSVYPSIYLKVKDEVYVPMFQQFELRDLVLGFGNIYNEDLSANLSVKSNVDLTKVGVQEVQITVSDDHNNEITKTVKVNLQDGVWREFGDSTSFTLLQNGAEKSYNKGYVVTGNATTEIALPALSDTEKKRVVEAVVGITGASRQFAKTDTATFKVEFVLATESGQEVQTAYVSAAHNPLSDSERILLQVPEKATHVRISSAVSNPAMQTAVSIKVFSFDTLGKSTIKIDPLKVFTGRFNARPEVIKTGSTGEVTYVWQKYNTTTRAYETISGPPTILDPGTYRVIAYLAADENYKGAVSAPDYTTIHPMRKR